MFCTGFFVMPMQCEWFKARNSQKIFKFIAADFLDHNLN